MIWITRILAFLLGFAATLVVIYAAGTAYGWSGIWTRLAGPADLGAVTFRDLKKGPKPNQALICPPGLCDEASVDRESPLYALSAEGLRDALLETLELEPRLERVDDGSEPYSMRFVQRSRRLGFPDTISVEVVPEGSDASRIALYSRSQIGRSDLGVNAARLERWLDRLRTFEVTSGGIKPPPSN